MDKYIIDGGRKLKGKVRISGSKNAALPIIVATLLTDEECVINNVPDLADIRSICALIQNLGKRVVRKGSSIYVYSSKIKKYTAPYRLVRKMRASFLVAGPLLVRKGRAKVSLPGGCAIGLRPVDIHLKAFKELGAGIKIKEGYVELTAKKLKARKLLFDFPSVGATENVMMAACLIAGTTVIENAAREPEIVDLAAFLNKMGASVRGAGTKNIVIEGRAKLSGSRYTVIPDRIEAATYLIAGAVTGGDVVVEKADASHLGQVIQKLIDSGSRVSTNGSGSIRIKGPARIKSVSIETGVYPSFPTDVQAQWMVLMSLSEGNCVVTESVFENRFLHAAELSRMGAKLMITGNTVGLTGVKELSGAQVMVSDLRAGAALVIAGLAAKGQTKVSRIYHLDRGYEDLHKKLKKLGAKIKRIKD